TPYLRPPACGPLRPDQGCITFCGCCNGAFVRCAAHGRGLEWEVSRTAEAVRPTRRMMGARAEPNSATRVTAARRGIAASHEPMADQEMEERDDDCSNGVRRVGRTDAHNCAGGGPLAASKQGRGLRS